MVSGTTETSITWTWNAVEGATAYAVQISMNETFDDDDVTAIALTATYTVSDLPPSTSVYLRVAAGVGTSLEDALLSDWSTHVTGMTATPPPPPEPPAVPSGLEVSASGEDFVEWTWNAVGGADGYEVQFSTNEMFDDAETIGRTADQTSYRRQPLPAGATAFVRVRSHSGSGEDRLESEWSTHVTGMTDQPMPPATPANLRVTDRGEGYVEWTWDEVEGADGYDVQYSLDDERFTDQEDATAEVAATETSYRLENLAADMDVYLRVRSFAGSGADRLESGWSTHSTGMTVAPPPMAPATPTGLDIAGMGDDFIEWSWDAVSGAEGYEVQISENSQFGDGDEDPIRDAGTALSYRQGDLDYATRRYLRVRAYIGSGADRLSSEWSGDATSVTNAAPAPPPSPAIPGGLTATGGEDFVTWTWRAVADVDGYQIQYSSNEAFTSTDPMDDLSAEELSYTRENLEGGTSHYLRVRSFIVVMDTRYESGWSSHVTGMTDLPRPAAPTGLAMDADATDHDSIGWEWVAVPGVDGYEAQFSSSQPFVDTDQIFNTDTTSHVVHKLQPEANGYLRVLSVIGTGSDARRSEWSATSTGRTTAAPAPTALPAPSGVRGSDVQRDSVTVTWDGVGNAETYEVQQSASDGEFTGASCDGGGSEVNDRRCIATGLIAGTAYRFRVRASAADRPTSDWSTPSDSVLTPGRAPTDPIPGGMGDLNVRWESSVNSITWIWDRSATGRYDYVVHTATAYDGSEDPCSSVAWPTDGSADGTAQTSHTEGAQGSLGRAAVRLLCVRPDGQDEERNVSFAWGITAPQNPDRGTSEVDETDNNYRTTEIRWGNVDLQKGFDYKLRLAADPERPDDANKIRAATEAGARVMQSACETGAVIDDVDPDVDLLDRTISWDGRLDPHTGYLLCVQALNSTGKSVWAVPQTGDNTALETFTRPDAPPQPKLLKTKTIAPTTDANEKLAPRWEILTRDDDEVPREATDFMVKMFHSTASSAKTLVAADCRAIPENYGEVGMTGRDEVDGFNADVPDTGAIERLAFTVKAYLCAQADNGDANGYGVGPWAISPVFNVTKPSGISLSSDSDSLTSTVARITIKNWKRDWYYKLDASGTTNDVTCGSAVSAGMDADNVSGLAANTSYSVTAWDDDQCAENRLASVSIRTKAQ